MYREEFSFLLIYIVYHMFSDRQIFAEVFWCDGIAGKIKKKKPTQLAPTVRKIYERILKARNILYNIYYSTLIILHYLRQ